MLVKFKQPRLYQAANRLVFGVAMALLLSLFMVSDAVAQRDNALKPRVGTAVRFDVSPPLRDIPPVDAANLEKGVDDRGMPGPVNDTRHDKDGALQDTEGAGIFNDGTIPGPGVNFGGMSSPGGLSPPDPVGDVGPNHYVQMVNSRLQVFSKTGASIFGPVSINTIWAGFGGACQNENAGDPIVLYDQFADRWLVTQFTAAGPNYFNCVALSQTGDPAGAYYRYAFSTGTNFPDYPKYGVWRDGYYISTREFAGAFAGVGAYALNRDQMLVGNPSAQVIKFLLAPGSQPFRTGDGLLPADIDGTTLPPLGSPAYFVGSMDNGAQYSAPADALNLFKFTADFVIPALSTFEFSNQLNVAAFDSVFPCSGGSRNCIPQPSTTNRLDILSYRQRPLHRLAYRNFGTHESMVTTQSVEAAPGIAGMRWWEIRSPNSSPVVFQDGTYAPGITDGVHRWMGSIAQDKNGNMLLGYSVSNGTVFPGVRYTGRIVTDPLNTMPQGEGTIVNGAGSQTGSQRWGDYSSMNIDSTDDCTFWYTNEYYSATSSTGWNTRIGSVTFPECAGPVVQLYKISGRVVDSMGRGIPGVRVRAVPTGGGDEYYGQTSLDGSYTISRLPENTTYTVLPIKRRFTFTSQNVMVTSSNTTGINFTAAPN